MPIRLGGARKRNWIPSGKMEHSFIGIKDCSDEMLIMTPSDVYKTRNVQRRPELEPWDFEFFTTLKGTPWNPNPAGEMAADALPADMAVPMPAPWWRRHRWTEQRAGCTSGEPMCRNMVIA